MRISALHVAYHISTETQVKTFSKCKVYGGAHWPQHQPTFSQYFMSYVGPWKYVSMGNFLNIHTQQCYLGRIQNMRTLHRSQITIVGWSRGKMQQLRSTQLIIIWQRVKRCYVCLCGCLCVCVCAAHYVCFNGFLKFRDIFLGQAIYLWNIQIKIIWSQVLSSFDLVWIKWII